MAALYSSLLMTACAWLAVYVDSGHAGSATRSASAHAPAAERPPSSSTSSSDQSVTLLAIWKCTRAEHSVCTDGSSTTNQMAATLGVSNVIHTGSVVKPSLSAVSATATLPELSSEGMLAATASSCATLPYDDHALHALSVTPDSHAAPPVAAAPPSVSRTCIRWPTAPSSSGSR